MKVATFPLVETETTSCVICLAHSSRKLGEIRLGEQLLGRVVRCDECDLRFMSPRPTQRQRDWLYEREYESELPGQHGETRFESVHNDQDQGRVRFARYLDLLEAGPQTQTQRGRRRLLDIGAGTGQLLKLARDRGWDVYAIEQSEEARRHLNGLLGADSVVGRDLATCHDSVGSFDAVVMAHVIEHLPDPLASLRHVKRLLTPLGQLLIATPNEVSLYERLWLARQRWRREGAANPYVAFAWHGSTWQRAPSQDDQQGFIEFQILTTEHLYFFTQATLRRLLVRAGFGDLCWSAGSVAPANSGLGRLLRNDIVNRAAALLSLQSELVVVADRGAVRA